MGFSWASAILREVAAEGAFLLMAARFRAAAAPGPGASLRAAKPSQQGSMS